MKPINRLCIIIIMSLAALATRAQCKVTNFDIRQGLPENSVNAIAQDARGFVWIGTGNGLARFDGVFFTVFRHDASDGTTVSNNNIHEILPVRDGIYIANDHGVDFYSYADSHFHHCKMAGHKNTHCFVSLAATPSAVFAADNNGCLYSGNGTSFNRVASADAVYAITAFANRLVTVGKSYVSLLTADGKRVLSRADSHELWQGRGCIYYSHVTHRLYLGNGIGTRSSAFTVNGDRLHTSTEYVPQNLKDVCDYDGGVAFATDGQGVVLRRDGTDTMINEANNGISGNAVYSLFADNMSNLWIGTYRKGVSQYGKRRNFFTTLSKQSGTLPFNVVAAVASKGGDVYIGMDGGGLAEYSLYTKSMHTYTSHDSGLCGDNIVAINADDHDVWLAVFDKGLVAFNRATHRFTTYRPPLASKQGDVIWTIADDGTGNLWVGGRDVFVFNKQSRRFRILRNFIGARCQTLCDGGKYMWLGNDHGLYKIDKRTLRTVKHYSMKSDGIRLPDNSVRYVYADSRGRVWVSFRYEPPCCIDERHNSVTTDFTRHGLGDNVVSGIVESRHGYMVFSTSNGLYVYYPSIRTFMRCDIDTQLPMVYNFGACSTDGQYYYFGSVDGLVMVKDQPMTTRSLFKSVSFSGVSVADGRTINLNGDNPKPLTLGCDENYFTINFSVPEYVAPRSLRFSYYMKGMEDGWNEMTDRRQASYTNVPPGKYEFLVRCTDLTGRWTQSSVLHIEILPPWYKTWWAEALWLLLAAGICFSAIRIYLRMLKMRHRMEIAEVERESQRRLNDAKMTFFTSITHELRTPVFLIAAQLEELISRHQSVVGVPSTYLMAMHRSAMKINKLISQAIDFRKMDQGKLTLKLQKIDTVEFVSDLTDDYGDLLDQKHINFSTSLPDHAVMLHMDGEKIEMCLNNLVSNAYKYTNDGGHVTLSVRDCGDRVVFSVKDDGIGIVPEAREDIFKNFYRTSRGEAKSRGDGIGLAFVQRLVEMHGGKITVDSEVNKGSEFSFFIPKSDADKQESTTPEALKTDSNATAIPHTTSTEDRKATVLTDGQQRVTMPLKANPAVTHTLLIVDDERETVALLERNLIGDFKVLKAYDGNEALHIAAESLPDLIVCDIMMPGLDGLEFLRTLRNDKKLQHIKVVIFTGQTSEEEHIAAYDAGADAYITKPVSLKLLRTRIDRLIAESDNAALTANIAAGTHSYNKEEQIFLLRCREIIDDNLANPDFNVDFLAEKLAMSHSSLYKKLKQMTGMSLIEFVNDYKIYKAVQAFKEGQTNVVKVAEMCGFGDIKNFRTLFKRKMQMTPKQYVQSL